MLLFVYLYHLFRATGFAFLLTRQWAVCTCLCNSWRVIEFDYFDVMFQSSVIKVNHNHISAARVYICRSVSAFIHRCKRCELCSVKTKTFAEICDISDDQLFSNITRNPHHSLNHLLPSVSAAAENYNLRPRKHNRHLPERTTRLFDANYIYRLLYSDIYWHYIYWYYTTSGLALSLLRLRSVNLSSNKRTCVL